MSALNWIKVIGTVVWILCALNSRVFHRPKAEGVLIIYWDNISSGTYQFHLLRLNSSVNVRTLASYSSKLLWFYTLGLQSFILSVNLMQLIQRISLTKKCQMKYHSQWTLYHHHFLTLYPYERIIQCFVSYWFYFQYDM